MPAPPTSTAATTQQYASAFFTLSWGGAQTIANFSELSGLDAEVEAIEYREANMTQGGLNSIRKVPGTWKFGDVTIKRAVDLQGKLFQMVQDFADGKPAPGNATITMYGPDGASPVATFVLKNAWPKKYSPAGLNAKENNVAVEEVVLAHEGFFRTDGGVLTGRHVA